MTAAGVRLLVAEGGNVPRHLPVAPWVIGLGGFTLLCLLLAVTLTFGKDR